jgi:hypothetical protein
MKAVFQTYLIDVLDIETGKTGRVTQILQLPRSDTKPKNKEIENQLI